LGRSSLFLGLSHDQSLARPYTIANDTGHALDETKTRQICKPNSGADRGRSSTADLPACSADIFVGKFRRPVELLIQTKRHCVSVRKYLWTKMSVCRCFGLSGKVKVRSLQCQDASHEPSGPASAGGRIGIFSDIDFSKRNLQFLTQDRCTWKKKDFREPSISVPSASLCLSFFRVSIRSSRFAVRPGARIHTTNRTIPHINFAQNRNPSFSASTLPRCISKNVQIKKSSNSHINVTGKSIHGRLRKLLLARQSWQLNCPEAYCV
jgi:hypothetical protein